MVRWPFPTGLGRVLGRASSALPRALRLALALSLLLVLPALPPAARAGEAKKRWVAVAPAALAGSLAPLVRHRREEGFDARVVESGSASSALKDLRPDYVLLVGDEGGHEEAAPWRLVGPRRPLYRWRRVQRPDFAADALLGDRDGDLLPDVPVGRIPARRPEEVADAVSKILAFEGRPTGLQDLRLVTWGGAPGYGALIDRVATALLVSTVRRHGPPWADRTLLSSAPASPFSGWPPDEPRLFDEALSKGAVLGAILAHANAVSVDAMTFQGRPVLLDLDRVRADFPAGPPAPPLLLLACDCGRFDGPGHTLAEELLFLPGGPVAVIAATTESHPLPNYYTGKAVLDALSGGTPRLGDLWVKAQRAARKAHEALIEKALADAEGSLEDQIDVSKLQRDQALLYELFGDPATRLHLPGVLSATAVRTEKGWRWTAEKPAGATGLVVALRSAREASERPEPGDADARRAALAAANAAESFHTVRTLGPEEPWSGEVEAPDGAELRLVALTSQGVFVHATGG